MIWTPYKEKVRRLSLLIVEAQRPIRILESLKWDPSIALELKSTRFKSMPKINQEYYARMDLGFEPQKKLEDLTGILQEIKLTLGERDPLAQLLIHMTEQYMDVVQMLLARGTMKFWDYSKKLYGSPKDELFEGSLSICELGQRLAQVLTSIDHHVLGPVYPNEHSAQDVVDLLNGRFKSYFGDNEVEAIISDGIIADAASGGDVVKIKEGATFSSQEIDILEVHEGWVHAGTTRNGNMQPIAKWLSKGPPRCSATQEGLAVIMEIFTFRSFPKRMKKINDRIIGISKAEDGANLLELIEFFRTEGYSEDEAIVGARRVFRGGILEGGAPFTKDISYCRGFIENYNFMRTAIQVGKPYLIPFLFLGKLKLDDIPLLYQKFQEGIIDAPYFLPPQFKDLNGIAVWMSFSNFFGVIDLMKAQEHYNKIFNLYL